MLLAVNIRSSDDKVARPRKPEDGKGQVTVQGIPLTIQSWVGNDNQRVSMGPTAGKPAAESHTLTIAIHFTARLLYMGLY